MTEYPEAEGKFNMASATLQRIHNSLEKISFIFQVTSGISRQRLHIDQVKIFFLNASTLLTPEMVKLYAPEVDGLKSSSKITKGHKVNFYDAHLEERLFQIVRELSYELRPYFMAYKTDPGRAVITRNN